MAMDYAAIASADSNYPGSSGYGNPSRFGADNSTVNPFTGTTSGGFPSAAAGTTTGTSGNYVDQAAAQNMTGYAEAAAQNAYNMAKLNQDSEAQAFAQAQQAYANALSQATTFGVSPGGTYNGMAFPAAGTPTMGQALQWANLYGTAAAPANPYQMTLAAQNQQFTQNQAAQQQAATLSGYYTPSTGGMLGSGVTVDQVDQALQNSLGRDYNQNLFKSMTNGLQGQNLANPNATAAINNAIKAASQGRLQDASSIAGYLGQGGYTAASPQQTAAYQQQMFNQALQQAGVTGMYIQPGTGPQAGQTSWDQLSQQLQAAAASQGVQYNDAAAKALYQQYTQGNQQGAFAGNQPNQINQAQMNAIWNAAGGTPGTSPGTTGGGSAGGGLGGGQMTTQYQQQLYNEALSTAQFQAGQAQDYLKLLSSLSGPANYGAYLKTLGATPGGIQDLVRAGAGAYIPGAGATTGVNPQAATLQSLYGSATTGQAQTGIPDQYTQQQQALNQQLNPQWQTVQSGQYPTSGYAQPGQVGQMSGGQNPYAAAAAGGSASAGQQNMSGQPLASNSPNAAPNGGGNSTSYQDFMNAAQNLPTPNQLAPQAWNAMTPSQQQMIGSMYTQLGYNADDVNKLFNQSLPTYAAGGGQSTGSFRLQ